MRAREKATVRAKQESETAKLSLPATSSPGFISIPVKGNIDIQRGAPSVLATPPVRTAIKETTRTITKMLLVEERSSLLLANAPQIAAIEQYIINPHATVRQVKIIAPRVKTLDNAPRLSRRRTGSIVVEGEIAFAAIAPVKKLATKQTIQRKI